MTTLPRSRPLTRDDLADLPDDGHRYELVDGVLVVSPAPRITHQIVVANLLELLRDAVGRDLLVLPAPTDVVLADDTVLQPDVLVARRGDFTETHLAGPPSLAVEVLSPSTRRIDLLLKRDRYAAAGCRTYLVVNPDEPSAVAYELRDGVFVEIGSARGGETLDVRSPLTVRLVPKDLVT